jgi:D-glycero-D-manno-heptose 1,7-bisphosphate phosphatase
MSLPNALPRRAIFFDRDGVLNVDKGYVYRIDDFIWIDGAIEAIKLAKSLGFLTIVVTNQSGIARGLYSIEDMNQLHQWMNDELEKSGTGIDKYYYCPYHDQGVISEFVIPNHPDRKPNPGMILRAINEFSIERDYSVLIGDKISDIEAANRASVASILFKGENLENTVAEWCRGCGYY